MPSTRLGLLLLVSACDGFAERPDASGSPLIDEQMSSDDTEMLLAHNEVRAEAQPTPQPALPPLTWSAALAADATRWAEGCRFEHSTAAEGENLYAASQPSPPAAVVTAWAGEAADYDLATDSCTDVCGHYTQLVWRDTARVGCGSAWCPNLFDGVGGEYWVCRYDPAGNWTGESPY